MRKLAYTPQSRRDLKAIARYITNESGSREVAIRFTERLRKKCAQLAVMTPVMGRARDDLAECLRSVPFRNYNIFLRYIAGSGEILEIVRIIEGHRLIEAQFAPRGEADDDNPKT